MPGGSRLRFGRAAGGGGPAMPATASFRTGAYTPQGRGGTRLSSVRGGLVLAGVPATWTVTQTGGTSGHFQDASGVAYATGVPRVIPEGATAMWPTPSAAGAGAKLNSAAPYTFEIKFTTAGLVDSNICTATLPIVASSANAGNTGSAGNVTDAFNAASALAVSLLPAPRYILLSRGIERDSYTTNGATYLNEVIIQDAEPAFPSNLDNFNFQNSAFISMEDITARRDTWDAAGFNKFRLRDFNCQDMARRRCTFGALTNAGLIFNAYGYLSDADVNTRITFTDSRWYWCFTGQNLQGSFFTLQRITYRWCHRPAIYLTGSFVTDSVFEDILVLSPRYISGSLFHTESVQRGNAVQVARLTYRRIKNYAADATWMGPFLFAGASNVIPDEDIVIEGVAYAGWAPYGYGQDSFGGVGGMKNATFTKVNTGQIPADYPPELGNPQPPNGPFVYLYADVGSWPGAYTMARVYTDENIQPNIGPVIPVVTYIDNYELNPGGGFAVQPSVAQFAAGSPKVNLGAYTFAQLEAMTDDQVEALFDAALLPTPLGALHVGAGVYVGAFNPDGSWNTA